MIEVHPKTNKEKILSDERYDEKLFKQAYKAALEARISEKKKSRNKRILNVVYIFLSLVVVSTGILVYIHFKPKYFEYIEPESVSQRSQFNELDEGDIFKEKVSTVNNVEISAVSAIAFNPDTGDILFKKNIEERRSVASLTKLVSALVVLDSYKVDDSIQVSNENVPTELSWRLELEDDFTMSIQDLLEAMLISSYNDAAFFVANAYPYGGYTGFIQAMNSKAVDLGMVNSSFGNPAGIDDVNNYSTALDIAKLVSAVLNKTEILDIVKKSSAVISWKDGNGEMVSKTIYTTNQLYGVNPYVKGLKTGITDSAAECFVGYFVYGKGTRLTTVVLGSSNRFEDTKILESVVSRLLKK